MDKSTALQSSWINYSFRSGRSNALFERQSIVHCHSQIESVTVAVRRLRSAVKDPTMADGQALGLIRKPVHGRKIVGSTAS